MDKLLKFTDRKISYLFNAERSIKKLIVSKKPVIVDIGGNIGQTCKMFKKIFPKSIIHTIEPNQSSFLKLKENTKKFKSINYYNYPLGNDKKKFIYLDETNNQSFSSLIPFNFNSISLKKKYHPKIKLNLVKNLKKIVHIKNSNLFFNKLIKIINVLIKKNFKIFDISNIYKTIKDSRTLWIDCIFVNTKYYNL